MFINISFMLGRFFSFKTIRTLNGGQAYSRRIYSMEIVHIAPRGFGSCTWRRASVWEKQSRVHTHRERERERRKKENRMNNRRRKKEEASYVLDRNCCWIKTRFDSSHSSLSNQCSIFCSSFVFLGLRLNRLKMIPCFALCTFEQVYDIHIC